MTLALRGQPLTSFCRKVGILRRGGSHASFTYLPISVSGTNRSRVISEGAKKRSGGPQ